ncbi:MAG: hypothetical protein RL266_1553 [Bacteroidota bacterium]|jgi:hypothetical protein
MKNLILSITFLLSAVIAYAQPEDHPHHEKHYADVAVIETPEIKVEIIRPHSQVNFSQFTIKVYNKTGDYILMKKHAITFQSDEMGYGKKHPAEDIDFVEPNGDITRQIKVDGGVGCKVDQLNISFDGVFSRAPLKGKPTEGGEFRMKPDKNSLMMEPFAVTLKKWRFDPKELSADFMIRYRGESVGIVYEGEVKIRKEDGSILENKENRPKPLIIPPMATKTVTVVRPFEQGAVGKGDSVFIVWDTALEESASTPFEVPGFTLSYDEAKTKKENK